METLTFTTMGVMRMQIPEQRWALPTDSDRDKYEYEFEAWVNENYDMKDMMINGRHMTWEQCWEDEWLFDEFLEGYLEREGD
jgi:hypothetical protein